MFGTGLFGGASYGATGAEGSLSLYMTVGGKIFLTALRRLTLAGKIELNRPFALGPGTHDSKEYPL
jgi:hypothetical protein